MQTDDSGGVLTMTPDTMAAMTPANGAPGCQADSQGPVGLLLGTPGAELVPRPPSPKYDERTCFFSSVNTLNAHTAAPSVSKGNGTDQQNSACIIMIRQPLISDEASEVQHQILEAVSVAG